MLNMFRGTSSIICAIKTAKKSFSTKQLSFSHVDKETGNAKMVSISNKVQTKRTASATSTVVFSKKDAFELLKLNKLSMKGDVLTVAKIAGINAAKQTALLIPLCHQINLAFVDFEFSFDNVKNSLEIKSFVETEKWGTGVEVEGTYR